jgi:hypothetical protein
MPNDLHDLDSRPNLAEKLPDILKTRLIARMLLGTSIRL